jgi:hypothetical protein
MTTALVFDEERVRCDKVGILEWECKAEKKDTGRDTKKDFGTVLSFSMGKGVTRRYVDDDTTTFEATERGTALSCQSDPGVLVCKISFSAKR